MLGVGPFGPLGRDRPELRAAALEAREQGAWNGEPIPERDALAVLATVEGLGPATLGRVLARHGGATQVLQVAGLVDAVARLRGSARRGEDGTPAGPGEAVARRIVDAAAAADSILARIRDAGLITITTVDDDYPARLRAIDLPPHVLFVRGSVEALGRVRSVAIVGTRRPTDGGRRTAAQLGGVVARCGAVVVSGLAVGIDGAAHAAVVAEGRPTVAVLGGGHVPLYPRAHARLAAAIVATGGAVVSEFAPDVNPTPGTFPRRNRLISGLADATIVVEAAARSGALTTAAWALEQGRGCFLVPGGLDAPMSAGCLAFLRECHGEARIVAGIPELLEDLGFAGSVAIDTGAAAARSADRGHPAPPSGRAVLAVLGGVERRVAESLVAGLGTADELVAAHDLPVATILGALTLLESRGLVAAFYGRYRPAGPLAAARPQDLPAAPAADGATA